MAEEGGVLHRCGRVDSVDWREHNEGMIHTLFTYKYTFFTYGYTFFIYEYTFFIYEYTFFHMGILS